MEGDRWLLAALLLAGLALFVYPLSLDIPLLDPDEGLHASIAQEMVEGGDWVTPRSLGEPFYDKPVLYFWAEAISLGLFGMSEWAVRLPGLVFGLLGVLTTALVAGRMFDRKTGILAALTYGTMILPTAMAQAAAHDVALVPWVNLAILLFWQSDRAVGFRAQAGYAGAIGVVLGLSILTKGLVGVALVGVVYGSYLLVTRRLTWAACVRGATALVIAGLVALPWYVAMEARNPGYLYYYFVERHVLGAVTQTQRHGRTPVWFYLPILLGGGLPWIAYLPTAVRDAWENRGSGRSGNGALVLLWCWLIGGTVLLSAAQSKLVTYIWPVFPAVAILAAVVWARVLSGVAAPGARRWLAATFCGLCASGPMTVPATMLVVQHKFHLQFSAATWVIAVGVALSAWIPLVFWWVGRMQRALVAGIISLAAQSAIVMTVVVPPVASVNTARDLARYFNARGGLPERLVVVDERIGSLVFYLNPELRGQLRQGQLQGVQVARIDEPLQASGTVFAMAERRLRKIGPPACLAGVAYDRAGQYRVYAAVGSRDSEAKAVISRVPCPESGASLPPAKRPLALHATGIH